jgi:hypothetical protein
MIGGMVPIVIRADPDVVRVSAMIGIPVSARIEKALVNQGLFCVWLISF